jgi:hypothetical protein
MTLVLHHVKKDLGFIRLPLAAWLVVLAASTVAQALKADLLVGDEFLAQRWSGLQMLVLYVLAIGAWFLAVRIVHADSPDSNTAFWVTRPVRPGSLVAAKLLSIAGLLVLLPAACQAIVSAANGVTGSILLQTALEAALLQAAFAVAFALLGSLTRDATRLVIAALVASLAWLVVPAVLRFRQFERMADPVPSIYSAFLVGIVLLLVAGVVIVRRQFVTRRTRQSSLLAFLAAVGTLALAVAWPVNLFGIPESRMPLGKAPAVTVTVGHVRQQETAGQGAVLAGIVETTCSARGTAAVPFAYEARLRFQDGTTVRASRSEWWQASAVEDLSFVPYSRSVHQAVADHLGARRGPLDDPIGSRMSVAEFSTEIANRYRQATADYDADFTSRLFKVSGSASTPLKAGGVARLASNENTITAVDRWGGGRITVMVRNARALSLFPRESPLIVYGLLNRARRELAFGTFHQTGGWSSFPGAQLQVRTASIRIQDRAGEPFAADADDWLAGAELVMVALEPLGTVKTKVHIPEFVIPDDGR